jgi:hypothetical protein
MLSAPKYLGLLDSVPVVRPSPIITTSQYGAPPKSFLCCAVASVKRNSYGPLVINVPGGVVLRRSVRFLKPPNPQIATTNSARASRMHPNRATAGMALRGGAAVSAGPCGGVQLGSTVPGSAEAALCWD